MQDDDKDSDAASDLYLDDLRNKTATATADGDMEVRDGGCVMAGGIGKCHDCRLEPSPAHVHLLPRCPHSTQMWRSRLGLACGLQLDA